MLAGTDAAVKKAVDSNGDGKLADDDQFKAAFKLATDDYVTFTFMDYQASLASYLDMIKSLGGSDALDKTAIDDELVLARPGLVRVGRPVRERRPRRQLRLPVGRYRLRRPQQEEHAAGLGAAGHDRLRRGPRRRRGDHRAARPLPQAARGQAGARPGRRDHRDRPQRDLRLVGRHGARRVGGLRRHARRRPRHHPDRRGGREDRSPTPSAGCSRSAAARPGSSSTTSSTATRRSRSSTSAAPPGRRPRSRPATSRSSRSRSPTRSS